MTIRVVVGVFAFVGVSICGVITSLLQNEMTDAVNQRLPEKQQFRPLGWHFPKNLRLWGEYARLYPNGALRKKLWGFGGLMFVSLVAAAWAIGILGH